MVIFVENNLKDFHYINIVDRPLLTTILFVDIHRVQRLQKMSTVFMLICKKYYANKD